MNKTIPIEIHCNVISLTNVYCGHNAAHTHENYITCFHIVLCTYAPLVTFTEIEQLAYTDIIPIASNYVERPLSVKYSTENRELSWHHISCHSCHVGFQCVKKEHFCVDSMPAVTLIWLVNLNTVITTGHCNWDARALCWIWPKSTLCLKYVPTSTTTPCFNVITSSIFDAGIKS